MTVAKFTRRPDARGYQTIIFKDGAPVADITPNAAGPGMWVHYFGETKCSLRWPMLVQDMDRAREIIFLAGGA